jgi:MFS family permease
MGVCVYRTSQQLDPFAFFNYNSAKAFGKLTSPSYNIGIIATLYVNNGWTKALHKPNAAQKGLITAIYYLGTWLSYVFLSSLASDRLGRRYAALAGTVVTCIGGAVQTGASGKTAYASMIIGRIISGFGNAVISTSVPLYQRFVGPYTAAPWMLTNEQ